VPPPSTVIDEKTAPSERPFTFGQRLALFLIAWVGYFAIELICRTLRIDISSEEIDNPDRNTWPPSPAIAPFWHRCVFPATFYFRDRDVSVMTSRSFDGEYIARIIEKFGFRAVRGSSSRGGVRALLGMHDVIEEGRIAAFTIDGPRGPQYVAKPGPVLLARNTGATIRCFYIAVQEAWVLNSWDYFVIPKPFTRAHVRWSGPIAVPKDSDSAAMQRYHAEMQAALDRVREDADRLVGSAN
jgi:lysophospholipid acyltransferase (LPLAT)-like uncharacterized protein